MNEFKFYHSLLKNKTSWINKYLKCINKREEVCLIQYWMESCRVLMEITSIFGAISPNATFVTICIWINQSINLLYNSLLSPLTDSCEGPGYVLGLTIQNTKKKKKKKKTVSFLSIFVSNWIHNRVWGGALFRVSFGSLSFSLTHTHTREGKKADWGEWVCIT
jgi:hypothetical protein